MQLKTTGVGTRSINFVIDTLIVFIIAFIGFKAHQWYVYYYRTTFYNFGWFFALAILLYYTLAEALTGRTVGKLLSQTKVVNQQGRRAGFGQILARSIIRLTIIDLFFIGFLDKPLHDYLTKTEVVEN